jgi:hypothetical protein
MASRLEQWRGLHTFPQFCEEYTLTLYLKALHLIQKKENHIHPCAVIF